METTGSARATLGSFRAWYSAFIGDFIQTQPDTIVGRLARNGGFPLLPTQRDAWLEQIAFLQDRLVGLTGALFLEFNIPRMGRRVDAAIAWPSGVCDRVQSGRERV